MAIARRQILYGAPVTLNAAAIQAWNTTPVEIAPAPGINRIIQPISLLAQYKPGLYTFSQVGGGQQSFIVYLDQAHPFSSNMLTNGQTQNSLLFRQTSNRILSFNTIVASTDLDTFPFHTPQVDSANKPLLLKGIADSPGGQIATTTRGAQGLGYAVNDTGSIDPFNNGTGSYKILTVGALGIVLTYEITDPGNGYVVASGLDTDSSGAGTGFQINITAINKGDGSLIVTPLYAILRLS